MQRFATVLVSLVISMLLPCYGEVGLTNVAKRAAKPLLAQRTWETDGSMPKKAPVAKHKPASEKAILVRINDMDITYGKLCRYVDMMAFLLKNKKPGIPSAQLEKFKKRNRKKFSDALFQRTLIDSSLASSNVMVSASVVAAKKSEFTRGFARKGQTFEDIKAAVEKAGYAVELAENFDFDVKFQSFVESAYSNDYFVIEGDLEKTKKRLADYNARATLTNKVVIAAAQKLLGELRSGAREFAAAADEFSQDTEKAAGGEIGDCDENDFLEDKSIWRKLSALKDGEVTDVLESDDGYVIYRRIKKNTAEESQTGAESLKLARIYFRRAYLYPEETDDELTADIEREKREAVFGRIVSAFLKTSKVTYPEGKYDAF